MGRNHRSLFYLISLICGFSFAIVIIRAVLMLPDTKPDEIGLGEGTVPFFSRKFDLPVQIAKIDSIQLMKDNVDKNGSSRDLFLWMGNSQMFGINQYRQGQVCSPDILFDSLYRDSVFLISYSIPNANLQEQYVVFKYLQNRFDIKKLILPIFFDDLRESDLREDILRKEVLAELNLGGDTSSFGKTLASYFSKVRNEEQSEDMKALNNTTQERVEKYLNTKLAEVSPIWASRSDIRVNIIYNYLFKYRNYAFSISPDTKRKIIPARYILNVEAFKRISEICIQKNIQLLVYIPPIRDDVEQPYLQEEYALFKNEVNSLKKQLGFHLINAEKLVPAKYWGLKNSTSFSADSLEVDFMHFQFAGHKLLADTLYKELSRKN